MMSAMKKNKAKEGKGHGWETPWGHFTGSLCGYMTQRLLCGGPSPLVEEMASVLPLECSLLSHRGWGDLRRLRAGPASG